MKLRIPRAKYFWKLSAVLSSSERVSFFSSDNTYSSSLDECVWDVQYLLYDTQHTTHTPIYWTRIKFSIPKKKLKRGCTRRSCGLFICCFCFSWEGQFRVDRALVFVFPWGINRNASLWFGDKLLLHCNVVPWNIIIRKLHCLVVNRINSCSV